MDPASVPSTAEALKGLETLLRDGPVAWATEAEPHVRTATEDSIRHFSLGTGDDNPLYTDADYAGSSVRRGLVASPLFVLATGLPRVVGQRLSAEVASLLVAGASIGEERWTFLRPVRPEARLERSDTIVALALAPHVRTQGAQSEMIERSTWTAHGTTYAIRDRLRVHGPQRSTARRAAKASYDDTTLNGIAAGYDAEVRRGANTRTVGEVAVGQPLDLVVRGPLTVTDLVTYRSAVGPGPLKAGALRIGHLNRRQHGRLFSKNDVGAWETAERLHWDEAHARRVGHPTAYDYSHTRPLWLAQMLTDWIGDGGWLAHLSVSSPGMNYVGDTHWLSGEVTSVAESGGDARVTLSIRAANQLGEVTCSGTAAVLLPASSGGVADNSVVVEPDAVWR